MNSTIDLHVHSKYSGDTDSEPEESIIRAISLGLDGIAFTEHYLYESSEPVEMLKEKYRDVIMIFRGVELSAQEGHCLVFGVNTDKLSISNAPVRHVVRAVNEAGGVVIPSHPYRKGTGIGEIVLDIPGICAIEGCNGANLHSFNTKAIETAQALHLPYTGGSDAHEPGHVGSCVTRFRDRVTSDNFLDLLKNGFYQGLDTRKISKSLWPF